MLPPAPPPAPDLEPDADDASGPFGVAQQAILLASSMDGMPELANTLQKLTVSFNDDGSVDVDADGTTVTIDAASLGLGGDASAPPDKSAPIGHDGMPAPPTQ